MELLTLQSTCFNNIKTLCLNYKKDGDIRKSEEYLNKRLKSLEEQWLDFSQRHTALTQEIEDKNINYFVDDVYNKAKQLYSETVSNIQWRIKTIKEQKESAKFDLTGMMDESVVPDEKLMQLLSKQECHFKALDRVMSKIDIKTISEKWEIEENIKMITLKWEAVDGVHWELDYILKGSNESYYQAFLKIEQRCDEMKRNLNSKLWSTTHYQQAAPKIQLPEFSGNYNHWISFKDLFLETIHKNPTINKAQKMQHLKTKLRGEAERLVKHLTVSADNYESCWEILQQRYDNRRLQFSSFMNSMMNLPLIQQPDAHNLKRMHDVIAECLSGINNIGLDTTTWDPVIVHLMSLKLDTSTYNEYIKSLTDHREIQNLNDLMYFLESKFMAYETMRNNRKEFNMNKKQISYSKPFYKPSSSSSNITSDNKKLNSKIYHTTYGQCPHCDGKHTLMQCPKFLDLDTKQRYNLVAKLHICKNCLFSHGAEQCRSRKTCKECNSNHHTLLHNPMKKLDNNVSDFLNSNKKTPSSNHLSSNDMEILLTTVQLQVQALDGTYVTLRALLDQGSQVNLITCDAAQKLRLPRKKFNATISGIGSVSGDCKGHLQLTCKAVHSNYTFHAPALIMKKITNCLPNSTFRTGNWPHLENLKLADPNYNVSRPVDLLLGADVYSDIILDGVLKGNHQSPTAQQTHLGWILCGKLKTLNCHVTLIDLKELTKFWECEDITQGHKDTTDDKCEEHYVKTVQRNSEGRYTVSMPFLPNSEGKLGRSKSIAIAQFLQLEKKFERNKKLAAMYREFMKEYLELEHMKPAVKTHDTSTECFLPHHGVLRESSTTTKLRTVFNASQPTSTGYSLNSILEKGPNLQKDILALLLKWRSYKYAFTADIEKMYRCIEIDNIQQQLQKIIWRNSPSENLQELQLCTVTYGTKCAPWLAMRTLKQLAIEDGHKYPAAAHVLQNEFYMDDLVSGHSSIQEAKDLQTSLIELLKGGGMNLRKWSSNHPALLEQLTEDQISMTNIFDFKHGETMTTLGLGWNPKLDTFNFSWNLATSNSQLTKRCLLSEISKLYDPLGWLAPITIAAKLLFQKVWLSKIGWNEDLPENIQNEWHKIKSELPIIKNITLNRWIGCDDRRDIMLLGFCDASEKAYASVIYSMITNEDGENIITLLVSKTRVAPLAQKITLPRLELCGALLLSQLMHKTIEALTGYNIKIQAWSDSQVVLAWLQGETTRWDKYVANRVTKIKKVIPGEQWKYVPSQENPADCASRGLSPSKLVSFKLWWQGPEFLTTTKEQETLRYTPCTYTTTIESSDNKVNKPKPKYNEPYVIELLKKYSSLTRVVRVTAWVQRFLANVSNNASRANIHYLATSELTAAREHIIKHVQRMEFADECKQLLRKEAISSKSNILKLQPYLDAKGILRVGGRLTNSKLSVEMKHPIILSHNGHFTNLVIDHAHRTSLHGGARLTLNYIRQRYWIIGGNRAVKAQLRLCVRCRRYDQSKNYQVMGDLPRQRVTPSRPFTHTGVDFTGHVDVKLNKGRGVRTSKGYIAIFVCMATKAVHIELVSDLSSEAFIAALQRLCARRGTPTHMYSDCGTNFIGAAKILKEEFVNFKEMMTREFFDEIGKMEIQWHFNAPAWPTAGGLWEAAVKSLKHHLRRVLGEQKLTYEEFSTLLANIEGCMNSRPLCALTEDPEEFYNTLTPGHFLTGSPTMSLQRADSSDIGNIDLRRRWQLTEHMFQQFWKRWSRDYLVQLQTRCKWNNPTKNIEIGNIVLIKEDNLPPGKWAMGRVQQVHPGADGYVRVTTLKTRNGTVKRPITKLAPLPVETKNTIEKQNSNLHRQSKPTTKPKGKTFMTLFAFLITMFTLLSQTYGSNASLTTQITPLESTRPVYYDTIGKIQIIHNEWTLLMYYNLTNYWAGVRQLENYLDGLTMLCQKTDPRYCKATLDQLNHGMDLLQHYNSVLLSPHKHLSGRQKRGLVDGVGYIANSLFGILDQHFAEKYEQDIAALHGNENYLLELIKNQTSIVELENEALKKNEKNILRQFSTIDSFMNETHANFATVKTELEVAMATTYFTSTSFSTYLLLNNLRDIQLMLFKTLTDVYKGHLDVQLITPADLIKQLNNIAGKLPRTVTLPVDDLTDVKHLYKLLYVKARVTESYSLFEIHIPLISDEDFILYRALPLPVRVNTTWVTWDTTSQYIAVNFGKSTYVTLSRDDWKLCIQLYTNNFVCNKNLPVYNLQNSNAPCEAKLLSRGSSSPCSLRTTSCDEAWIELHAPNTWLTICCSTCMLRTICDNDISSHTVTHTGIIAIPQGCVLQSNDMTLYSHNQYNSYVKTDFGINIPTPLNLTVNRIINLSHNHPSFTPITEDLELKTIDDKLMQQKKQEILLPATVSNQTVHLYGMGYVVLGIIASVLLRCIIKKYFTQRSCVTTRARRSASEQATEDIELQPVGRAPPARGTTSTEMTAATTPPRAPARAAAFDNVVFNLE